MTSSPYTPPKKWVWEKASGGKFADINRPIAGPTHDKELPVGKHPFQLYSLATPNGVKVTVMFEELLAAGYSGAEYDAWLIDISKGDQFGSGFVALNPNSKIPALQDRTTTPPTRVFESGAILLHLAEKFRAFLPANPPYLGGGFGHFYAYAPEKWEYPINRFAMEVKRQLDVLNRHLADNRFMVAQDYTIADIAIWAWYGQLALGRLYGAAEFLDVESYEHVQRWAKEIDARPAVQRGRMVNCAWGDPETQLHERHDASDFETSTQDKLAPAKAS